MKVISSRHHHFYFDRTNPPVLNVVPGEEVTFETLDACAGEVRSVEQFLARRTTGRPGNPLTGPVFVEGAEPGDTLRVDVLRIDPDSTGFQLIGPNRALIDEEISDWTCYPVRVEGREAILSDNLRVRVDPVVGTFGNSPAGPVTDLANPLGGNLDVPAARMGSRWYIPIEVPGALFSLGDVHACQGDGEVVGAPEIGARVTVCFQLIKGRFCESVMIEDETHWHSPRSAKTEAQAAKLAVFQNARFIGERAGRDFKEALVLLTMVGRLSIARTGRWGPNDPVVCSSFPREILRSPGQVPGG